MSLRILLVVVAALTTSIACSRQDPSPAPAPTVSEPALHVITDPSEVCMINHPWMGKPQIPVPVDGKTYFGCCEACKAKLANDAAARTAQDPVTGQPVDKALAILARDDAGTVYYFASEATLRQGQAPRL
jgi:YHS domain-containing protein